MLPVPVPAAVAARARMRACPRSRSPKTVAESRVELTQLMEATDVNIAGTVHGGVVMRLVDTAAGLAAIKHAGGLAVTVAIDEMTFLEPVHIGDLLVLRATVNDVGRTSMECGVRVEAHDPVSGTMRHANSAYLVFVAVDDDGHPRPVPPLAAETDRSGAASARRSSGGRRGSPTSRPSRPLALPRRAVDPRHGIPSDLPR